MKSKTKTLPTDAVLRDMLEQAGIDSAGVQFRLLGDGMFNAVFAAETNPPVVLKIAPRPQVPVMTYEQNMLQAKAKADDLLQTAQRTANSRSEEIIAQAQQQAAQIKSKAADDIALEKKKAINEAKDEISDLAMAIAGKVVGRELNAGDQAEMIDRFIDELGDNV